MYPIRFEPIYQTYVWGGDKIASVFSREVDLPRIAESWEISDRKEQMSVVANGPLKGKTLHELVEMMKEELLGEGQLFDRFPVLTKIIDAKENLSIQVHPDRTMASKLKAEPKAEMWVMLEDGATVLAGLEEGIDENKFKKAIEKKTAELLLKKFEVKKGEVINIPGGRVHAICAGSLLYEVQQNSDTTYRLYDWGRDRELHLEKGLQSIRWDDKTDPKITPHHLSSDLHHQIVTLLTSPEVVVERVDVFDELQIGRIPKSFQIFFCMSGKGTIEIGGHVEPFEPGMTYLVPAKAELIEFKGRFESLRIRLAI